MSKQNKILVRLSYPMIGHLTKDVEIDLSRAEEFDMGIDDVDFRNEILLENAPAGYVDSIGGESTLWGYVSMYLARVDRVIDSDISFLEDLIAQVEKKSLHWAQLAKQFKPFEPGRDPVNQADLRFIKARLRTLRSALKQTIKTRQETTVKWVATVDQIEQWEDGEYQEEYEDE